MYFQIGGYPLLEGSSWNSKNDFTWWDYAIKSNELGLGEDYIVRFDVDKDYRNVSRRIVHFDQPSLGIDRDYLIKGFNDSYVQAYYKLLVDSAVMLGADQKEAETQLEDALRFEMRLAEASDSKEYRRDDTNKDNPMSLNDMEGILCISQS